MFWALVVSFKNMSALSLGDIDIQNWGFLLVIFFFDEYEVSFLISVENFWFKVYFTWYLNGNFSLFLGSICMEKNSRLLLWGNICLCHLGVLLVNTKLLDQVFIFSLLACVILLGNWVHWCWVILRTDDSSCNFCCWRWYCVYMSLLVLLWEH